MFLVSVVYRGPAGDASRCSAHVREGELYWLGTAVPPAAPPPLFGTKGGERWLRPLWLPCCVFGVVAGAGEAAAVAAVAAPAACFGSRRLALKRPVLALGCRSSC